MLLGLDGQIPYIYYKLNEGVDACLSFSFLDSHNILVGTSAASLLPKSLLGIMRIRRIDTMKRRMISALLSVVLVFATICVSNMPSAAVEPNDEMTQEETWTTEALEYSEVTAEETTEGGIDAETEEVAEGNENTTESITSTEAIITDENVDVLENSEVYYAMEETADAEDANAGEARTVTLPAPKNLHEENGFIVWDEVEGAYGYTLQMYEGGTISSNYYENRVEFDRFCYEKKMDFGDYSFKVCAFDEDGTVGEWSNTVTVSYSPTLETPKNVRLSDDKRSIVWDNGENGVLYNVRITNCDTPQNVYTRWDTNYFYPYNYRLYLSSFNFMGNYSITFQVMDDDYNVSDWSDPIVVLYTAGDIMSPQNVRFDESGNNILWDAVEGACNYAFYIDGDRRYYTDVTDTIYYNWKSRTYPFSSDGKYTISIYARNADTGVLSEGASLEVTFNYDRDETINLPQNILVENGKLSWENIEEADGYWLRIYKNGKLIRNEDTHYVSADENDGVRIDDRLPEGVYSAELFVVDKNYNFNSKTYTFTLDTPHNSTVWTPKMFYKFETLLWDFDKIRNPDTNCFWVRINQDGETICLEQRWSGQCESMGELPNGEYEVQVCVYDSLKGLGPWSEPLSITKHNGGLFDKENEISTNIEPPSETEGIADVDRITSITINPAFNMKNKNGNNVALDLTKIKVKASEIYDEAGLKRLEEALGRKIKPNQHYNLLDMTLLYDGNDFSNGYEGLVQVKIPIPAGHRDKTFTCYRLVESNGKTIKEIIPGEQTEDSYIIYLEHFSEM
ncbi:MAG: hypothetical protein NC393_12645 [Clostridium sp.]|nr:hypothetical protein [Clostridium sp.]MCM1209960.1 hypothetical protein [Ruminococcus sp.]